MKKQAKPKSNNEQLRSLWEKSGLTQVDALDELNEGQARPIAMSTFKAYLTDPDSARYRECPEAFLQHAQSVLGRRG